MLVQPELGRAGMRALLCKTKSYKLQQKKLQLETNETNLTGTTIK